MDASQLGLILVECFWAWSQANSCSGIYSQEYHKYDSLLALHSILFLNYDFHHSSKNRGWLWNIASAPAFCKGYTFLILFRFWGFSFHTGALLDQGCDAGWWTWFSGRLWEGGGFQQLSSQQAEKETCKSPSAFRSDSETELCWLLVCRTGLPWDTER